MRSLARRPARGALATTDLAADEGDRAGDDAAEGDQEQRAGAIQQATEGGNFGLRHDTIPFLGLNPSGASGCPIWTVLR